MRWAIILALHIHRVVHGLVEPWIIVIQLKVVALPDLLQPMAEQ
jgi:hypothetical protein